MRRFIACFAHIKTYIFDYKIVNITVKAIPGRPTNNDGMLNALIKMHEMLSNHHFKVSVLQYFVSIMIFKCSAVK